MQIFCFDKLVDQLTRNMTDLILISEAVVRTFSVDKVFRPATLIKKRLWHRCFPLNFVKFLRTSLFYRIPPMAASVISCLPISRSLFYHLDVNDTSCYTLNITVQIFSLKYDALDLCFNYYLFTFIFTFMSFKVWINVSQNWLFSYLSHLLKIWCFRFSVLWFD